MTDEDHNSRGADAPSCGSQLECEPSGRVLCQAFADTFNGGGWADAPSWDDYDDDQKARWNLAAARYAELTTPDKPSAGES